MINERRVRFYGVKESTTLVSELDQSVEEIIVNGFTIVADAIEDSKLAEVRTRIDKVYETQVQEVGGEQRLQQINDAFIGRCLLAYDEYFFELARLEKIMQIAERLLGDYYTIAQQNAVINFPDERNFQASWHRDLAYQHFVASRPLAISALLCVDNFSELTGGTYVLPASHKIEKFPSIEFVQRHEQAINAKAGSALVFDSMLYHRGGFNLSPMPRRGINHLYTLPFIKQQISLPQILKGKYRSDPFLSKFLGYESEPAAGVLEWRTKRLESRKS